MVATACAGTGDGSAAQEDRASEVVTQGSSTSSSVVADASVTSTSATAQAPVEARSPETRPPRPSASTPTAGDTVSTAVVSTTALEVVTETTTTETTTTETTAAETAVTETTVTETSVVEVAVDPTVAPAANTPDRNLAPQAYEVFATFEEVILRHPSNRVERIGFHESNHDGARQLVQAATAVDPMVMGTRNRGTGSRTAADIVVQPGTEIRSPVTGTVLRAGGYILYCKHNDDFVVIEPDAHPGWEVKVLHISGVTVSTGDRVEAGVTVVAPMATPLPFDSQVDEFTGEPSWPHVHIELVDPSIPDRPSSGGGGC